MAAIGMLSVKIPAAILGAAVAAVTATERQKQKLERRRKREGNEEAASHRRTQRIDRVMGCMRCKLRVMCCS